MKKIVLCLFFLILAGCDEPHPNVTVTDVIAVQGNDVNPPMLVVYMKNQSDISAHDIEAVINLEQAGEIIETAGFLETSLGPGEILIQNVAFPGIADHQAYDRYYINLVWHDFRGDRYHNDY